MTWWPTLKRWGIFTERFQIIPLENAQGQKLWGIVDTKFQSLIRSDLYGQPALDEARQMNRDARNRK